MIGAGGGQDRDAANLLKPALARGELRTVAATTWSEYKKYFEKDAALARRFQVVKVEEPTEAQAVIMMRGLVRPWSSTTTCVSSMRRLRPRCASRTATSPGGNCLTVGQCARHGLRGWRLDGWPLRPSWRIVSAALPISTRRSASWSGRGHRRRLSRTAGGVNQESTAESRLVELEAQWEEERRLIGALRTIRDTLGPCRVWPPGDG